MLRIFLYLFLLFGFIGISYSVPTNISNCQEINVSGEYLLNQSVTTVGHCFDIVVDNSREHPE